MPHQIALPDDICTDRNFTLIRRFVSEHGLTCRTRTVTAVWEDGKQEQWRLHCFADRAAAAAFLDRFGGIVFDPKRTGSPAELRSRHVRALHQISAMV